jgi:hypothetical protein
MFISFKATLNLFKIFFLVIIYLATPYAFSSSDKVVVKGFGDNENTALSNAKKVAIGQVCGETILGSSRSTSESQKSTQLNNSGGNTKTFNNDTKVTDDNLSLVGGFVKAYKITNRGKDNTNVYVEIEATVTDCKKTNVIQSGLTNQELVSQLQKINAEMKNLDSKGLVSNPDTLAQKYHNARILSQRGEVDLALKAYEQVVKEKIVFADPLQDMVLLSKRVYGQEGSRKYLQKALSNLNGRPEYLYAMQLIETDKPVQDGWKITQSSTESFPPLGYIYLRSESEACSNLSASKANRCLAQIPKLDNIDAVATKLQNKLKSGEYLNYYIDSNKASQDVDGFRDQFSLRHINNFRKFPN